MSRNYPVAATSSERVHRVRERAQLGRSLFHTAGVGLSRWQDTMIPNVEAKQTKDPLK